MDDAALAQRAATKKLNDTLAAGQKAIAQTSALDPEANRTSAEMLRHRHADRGFIGKSKSRHRFDRFTNANSSGAIGRCSY